LCYHLLMQKQVVYVHGGDSFSQDSDFLDYLRQVPIRDLPGSTAGASWKRTLAADLGEEFEVFMPIMPNKQNANYEAWKIWLERHFVHLRDGVILIGASLGGMFLAKYLSEEELPFTVAALYLLAAPSGEFASNPKEGDCLSFKFLSAGTKDIAKKVGKINVWHSEDDFVVPVSEAFWYQKHLPTAEVRIFTDKNHFLGPELSELLESIRTVRA
jgi:uncharacterized protein